MKELWLKIRAQFNESVRVNLENYRIMAASDGSFPIEEDERLDRLPTHDQVFLFLENGYKMRKIVGFSYEHNREILNAKECFEFSELTNAFLQGVKVNHLNNIVSRRNRQGIISKFTVGHQIFEGWSK